MSNTWTCKLPHLKVIDKSNKDNHYHMYVVLNYLQNGIFVTNVSEN